MIFSLVVWNIIGYSIRRILVTFALVWHFERESPFYCLNVKCIFVRTFHRQSTMLFVICTLLIFFAVFLVQIFNTLRRRSAGGLYFSMFYLWHKNYVFLQTIYDVCREKWFWDTILITEVKGNYIIHRNIWA